MFRGHFEHAVDDKGRVAVPIRFRKALSPGSKPARPGSGTARRRACAPNSRALGGASAYAACAKAPAELLEARANEVVVEPVVPGKAAGWVDAPGGWPVGLVHWGSDPEDGSGG
jgi:hypothetical protein